MRLISLNKFASKRTRLDSLNVLRKVMEDDQSQETLKQLIQINSNEKHLVQLTKF